MDWYQQTFVATGRSAALWALLAFFVTFAVTRGVTRRIRAKKASASAQKPPPQRRGGLSDIYIGGIHVHHQVWGILLVLLTGLLQFRYSPEPPWSEVLAALFGAGAALTLDEFAMWLYLDDVYWGEEGRKSIDAILLGGVLGTVLLLQASPVGPSTDVAGGQAVVWAYLGTVTFHLGTAVVCFLKSKFATGLIGIVVPLVALVGAIRLAKPRSVWARRRYDGPKLDRSGRRFGAAYRRRWDRVLDLVGGAPEAAPPDQRPVTTEDNRTGP
jgi:hypothetical protein